MFIPITCSFRKLKGLRYATLSVSSLSAVTNAPNDTDILIFMITQIYYNSDGLIRFIMF